MKDRFTKLAEDYGELYSEVFVEIGLNYQEYEESIYNEAKKIMQDLKNISILDVGAGDGETSRKFIEEGCENITALDLSPQMLEAIKKKFGNQIKTVLADAVNLSQFKPNQFDLVIFGSAVHNIPKISRQKFWAEMIRLSPKAIIMGERIVDPDPVIHKKHYDDEVKAIKKVYAEKHKLIEAAKEWIKHFERDEIEGLEIKEIVEYLGKHYDVKVVGEYGLCKTVSCIRN